MSVRSDRREFLALGLASLAAPSLGRAAGEPVVLRRAVASEVTSLDPQRPTGTLTREMAAEMFTGLVTVDAMGRLSPGGASGWTMSKDGLLWTFAVRPNMRWSDGAALTAADFAYSLRRYLQPDTGAPEADRLDSLVGARDFRFGHGAVSKLGITVDSPTQLTLRLERPDLDLPLALTSVSCVPEHVITKHGRQWAKPETLVSNGAYTLDSWAAGARVIKLQRNRYFHDAKSVAIRNVHWLTGYDDATRYRLFQRGEAEIAALEDASALARARREFGAQVSSVTKCALGAIGINLLRKPLDDPRIRRALVLAADRTILADKVRGLGERPWDGFLPLGIPDYEKPLLPEYAAWPMAKRRAEAQALMADARAGTAVPLQLGIGFPASGTGERAFLALRQMWRAIGVQLELQPLEGRAYLAALIERRFDLFSHNSFAMVPSATPFLERFASTASLNFTGYKNPTFDRNYALAQSELTVAARANDYAVLERELFRDLPMIPLFIGATHRLVSPRVSGWTQHPGVLQPTQFLSFGGRKRAG